ncbi:hypothetical protein [uncultured Thiodictyon sp.]|uniref:hypothetical protein n=1 Tax=uncultured Thiodictyon sp. TaxID=1846217 RepID=UPI0025E2DBCB|nr:hypothetical protein [uncultured Thiodictyon sp.]
MSPDGTRVATASWDSAVRVMDLQAGRALHTLGTSGDRILISLTLKRKADVQRSPE